MIGKCAHGLWQIASFVEDSGTDLGPTCCCRLHSLTTLPQRRCWTARYSKADCCVTTSLRNNTSSLSSSSCQHKGDVRGEVQGMTVQCNTPNTRVPPRNRVRSRLSPGIKGGQFLSRRTNSTTTIHHPILTLPFDKDFDLSSLTRPIYSKMPADRSLSRARTPAHAGRGRACTPAPNVSKRLRTPSPISDARGHLAMDTSTLGTPIHSYYTRSAAKNRSAPNTDDHTGPTTTRGRGRSQGRRRTKPSENVPEVPPLPPMINGKPDWVVGE